MDPIPMLLITNCNPPTISSLPHGLLYLPSPDSCILWVLLIVWILLKLLKLRCLSWRRPKNFIFLYMLRVIKIIIRPKSFTFDGLECALFVLGTLRRPGRAADIKSRAVEVSNNHPKLDRNFSAASDMSSISSTSVTNPVHKRTSSWCFDQKLFLQSLYKVLASVSETGSIILYLRDVEKLLLQSERLYNLFQKLLNKLPHSVLILGSRMLGPEDDYREVEAFGIIPIQYRDKTTRR